MESDEEVKGDHLASVEPELALQYITKLPSVCMDNLNADVVGEAVLLHA
jgi:hypothetical protein